MSRSASEIVNTVFPRSHFKKMNQTIIAFFASWCNIYAVLNVSKVILNAPVYKHNTVITNSQ